MENQYIPYMVKTGRPEALRKEYSQNYTGGYRTEYSQNYTGGYRTEPSAAKDGVLDSPVFSPEKAVAELEAGVVVTVFSPKQKREVLTLCLRTEQEELVCVRAQGSKPLVTLDLCQIKEVVADSWVRLVRSSEDASREKPELCITLYYGATFMLQSINFIAKEKEHKYILIALETSIEKLRRDNPYAVKQRWLRREFSKIQIKNCGFVTQQKNYKVSLKKVQTWFNQMTDNISRAVLILTSVKLKTSDRLDFNHFCNLVIEIMRPNPIVDRLMREFGQPLPDGKRLLPLSSFENFLHAEQNEMDRSAAVVEKMLCCLPVSPRTENPGFSTRVFEDYLFSSVNSIVNPVEYTVHQNMDLPLCNYWIASSHNTYLTGDQWKGESHVETYTRCLQMGCRCVELDCWDGQDGRPVITHGKSLTSKIKASDVLQTIKEHAWNVTDFPLVLSIENHCNLSQQRLFASMLKEIFQEELLTSQVNPDETFLPSPNQLKRKIIIKNKKLQRDWKYLEAKQYVDFADLSDEKKQGIMHMKYAAEKIWKAYSVILTDTYFCFTPHIPFTKEEEDAPDSNYEDDFDNCDSDEEDDSDEARPLSSLLWYHGAIDRTAAEEMLEDEKCHGNGTFLVRDSGKGGLALSFYADGRPRHIIIHQQDAQGHKQYLIGDEMWHDSIPDLIDYYRTNMLTFTEMGVSISFTYPVKRKLGFEDEVWYRSHIDRLSAETFLKCIPQDGVFLVRPSSVENCFSLSLRYHHRISHYQIEFKRNKFVIGTFRFPTMNKLIDYFTCHPVYKSARLTQPATEALQADGIDKFSEKLSRVLLPGLRMSTQDIYTNPECYCDVLQYGNLVTVRALYDFHASGPDELSFVRGSYITNVVIEDRPWWRGDHAGQVDKLFPANYVEIVNNRAQAEDNSAPSETMLRLSDCHIDNATYSEDGIHYFTLAHPTQPNILHVGSRKILEIEDWLHSALGCTMKISEENEQEEFGISDSDLMFMLLPFTILHESWNLEIQRQERMKNIAQELSDIVVYFQAVPYNPFRPGKFCETSSLSEERVGRDDKQIIQYNQFQISRVYPKYLRVTSTNFDPIPKWNVGCQMVALNYQTPDKPMQINQAMFAQNGRCGYVLKPRFMNTSHYNPSDSISMKKDVEVVVLTVTVQGGRNLGNMASAVGVMQPFVMVEVLGLPLDCQTQRTKVSQDKNVLNPVWKNEVFVFHISCPDLAFIRFEVGSEVSQTMCLGQATFHMKSIRQGYRSVPLRNGYSEPLASSSLLVHINIRNPKEEEEKNVFRIIEETRRLYMEISESVQNDKKREQLLQTEQKLLEFLKQSRQNGYRKTWRH